MAEALSSKLVPTESLESSVTETTEKAYNTHKWSWRGYTINYATAGCGAPILLVHGFGASVGHWRKNIPVLAHAGYKVYAIDLLGFGESDKPITTYSLDLWKDLVLDFIAQFPQQPTVLVGNSIGSLVSLIAARDGGPLVRATVLLNCAGGMNSKANIGDYKILLARPVLALIDLVLNIPPLRDYLFNKFRSPDNLRSVLKTVYRNQDAVDDDLVEIMFRPSEDSNAPSVFANIVTGDPGMSPTAFASSIESPMLILWGDTDPWTPHEGPVARYLRALADGRDNVAWELLEDVGHCPHDDRPELVHARLLPWLAALSDSDSRQ